jgi:hypothetical protein
MSTVKKIEIDATRSLRVHGLVANKAAAAQRIVVSERGRVWIIDSKDTLRCSRFGELRCERAYFSTLKTVPLRFLQEDDVRALGALGVLYDAEVIALRRTSIRARFFDSEMESIEYDVKRLAGAGISVPRGWRKVAEAHANNKADEKLARKFPVNADR